MKAALGSIFHALVIAIRAASTIDNKDRLLRWAGTQPPWKPVLAESRASRLAAKRPKGAEGRWRLPLVLNVASQLVLHIHYHHDFVQLCMHDPKRSSGENRVSKIATSLVLSSCPHGLCLFICLASLYLDKSEFCCLLDFAMVRFLMRAFFLSTCIVLNFKTV